MKALELIGEVDATHRLQVQVPEALPHRRAHKHMNHNS